MRSSVLSSPGVCSPATPGGRVPAVLRPESWTRPVGASPVRVIAREPGSRPRFVVERWRAERGVKSLFGGSKRAGRSAIRHESCSLVRLTMGEPSRSRRGEGPCPTFWPVPEMPLVGSPRGMGGGTYVRSGSELQNRLWAAAKQSEGRRFHALYDRIYQE